MKIQFVTDDGKIFNTKEDAIAYETTRSSYEKEKDEAMDKIKALDKQITDAKTELFALIDKKNELLDEWRDKYMDEDEKMAVDYLFDLLDAFSGK